MICFPLKINPKNHRFYSPTPVLFEGTSRIPSSFYFEISWLCIITLTTILLAELSINLRHLPSNLNSSDLMAYSISSLQVETWLSCYFRMPDVIRQIFVGKLWFPFSNEAQKDDEKCIDIRDIFFLINNYLKLYSHSFV